MPAITAIAIGGSAGALPVLKDLLPRLPAGLSVSVMVVLHVPSGRPTLLPELFSRLSVPVDEAFDKAPPTAGVWFAPSGYHLHVERDGHLALSVDPPVLHSRPSIDVLFESAAAAHGQGLVALLLSGASADGAEGLRAVVAAGGLALAQDPDSAMCPVMPAAGVRAGARPCSVEELGRILAAAPTSSTSGPDS